MSKHPTTFHAEYPNDANGVGWDDCATLHRLKDGGGLLHGFKALRKGTLAELLRFVATLPLTERSHYMIEKAGDRQYHPSEILALIRRDDFPAAIGE